MFNLVIIFILSFLIIVSFYFVSLLISFKDYFNEKVSSYECGFDSVKGVNYSFSITFFSVILMFVIFELEVIIFIFLVQNDVFSLLMFMFLFLYVVVSFMWSDILVNLVWKI
uniref:NADH-ubiquinone oxidoreductase chain 3 n=1 Tax=Spirocerca lupi TaxID=304461 RepID=M9QCV7_9BILA|nr:NADH dehydrogenase subunit 3 [Spirocerca lupi]AGI51585.1 NADH dehydrogenase subunit 3 [Spirocerca lupi]